MKLNKHQKEALEKHKFKETLRVIYYAIALERLEELDPDFIEDLKIEYRKNSRWS